MDHLLILLYNMIEPVLVGSSLSVCLQLPMVSGLGFIVLTLVGIVPLLLSGKRAAIKCKSYLAIFMGLVAVVSLGTKGYYYYELQNKDITNQETIDLYHLFGIWQG
jgi:hypothetical protein